MRKVFSKSCVTAILCVILSAVIFLCSCGQVTFIQSIKEGMKIQKGDFEITANVNSDTGDDQSTSFVNEIGLKANGTVNNEQSMYMDVSMNIEDEETKLTTLIIDENMLYIDIEQLSALFFAGNPDISEALSDKKYIYVDLNELSQELDTESDIEYNETNIKGVELLLYKLIDVADKSAQNTNPSVLGQDENKYTFSLTEKNLESFLHNLANTLEKEKNWFLNDYVNQLKSMQAQELAEQITENQENIQTSYDELVTTLKDFSSEDLEDNKFNIEMYSEIKAEESKVWNFGISGTYEYNDNPAEIKLDMTITENKEDKEIPSVSKNEAIDYKEFSELTSGGINNSSGSSDFDIDSDFNFEDDIDSQINDLY